MQIYKLNPITINKLNYVQSDISLIKCSLGKVKCSVNLLCAEIQKQY